MKLYGVLLLVVCAYSSVAIKSNENQVPDCRKEDRIFDLLSSNRSTVMYTSQNDIVKLFLPWNALNFYENRPIASNYDDFTLFFVEGKRRHNGVIASTGLYVLKMKVSTKLLDNGRDFVAPTDDSKTVYFAATDGLYVYNEEKNKAEKYGTVTDNIISITKMENDDALYILTEDKQLYKVTNEGNEKVKIAELNDAVQIIVHISSLYYVDSDNVLYVVYEDGVKKISGLPCNPNEIRLVTTSTFCIKYDEELQKICILVAIVDDMMYRIFANGTSEFLERKLQPKPTAIHMDGFGLLVYFAYDKKIYLKENKFISEGEYVRYNMTHLNSYV